MDRGRRLTDLEAGELLSWCYYIMVDGMDNEQRQNLDYALLPTSAVEIDDPELHESMQGLRPPSWWKGGTPVEGVITTKLTPE